MKTQAQKGCRGSYPGILFYVCSAFVNLPLSRSEEEVLQLAVQDEDHAQRGDELHADAEEAVAAHGMPGLLHLLLDDLRPDLPADHQGHQQGAQRHHDALRQHIPEVQPAVVPHADGGLRQVHQLPRREAGAAQLVGAHQDAAHAHGDGSDEGVRLALVALAGIAGLIHEVGHNDLQQGDGGGDGGEHHQQVEQDAEDGACAAHAAEHVLHGDEQQLRAAQRAIGVQGEAAGDDAQAGHQGHQRIHGDDEDGIVLDVLLFIQIGAVGDHGTHAQGQGEEHLAAGGGKHRQEVGRLLDDAVGNGPAGDEHVLQALRGAGEGAGADDADQQGHEQGGHAHGADLLDTAADAAQHDEHGQGHEDQAVDDGLAGAGDEGAEHLGTGGRSGAEGGAEQVAHVQDGVLDAVAAQRAVEEQNEEGGQDAHPAHPPELLGQDAVGLHGTFAGLAADGQLAHHDDEAAQDRQNEVDDEERKTAGGAHLVGEAPDVAQADCRADRGHQETKIGSKAFSFFHVFSPYNFPPPYPAGVFVSYREKKTM